MAAPVKHTTAYQYDLPGTSTTFFLLLASTSKLPVVVVVMYYSTEYNQVLSRVQLHTPVLLRQVVAQPRSRPCTGSQSPSQSCTEFNTEPCSAPAQQSHTHDDLKGLDSATHKFGKTECRISVDPKKRSTRSSSPPETRATRVHVAES
jgi:hypothetical protein